MISVGIDIAKDKHDCFIVCSEGEVLADVFTISNSIDGFHCLLQKIGDCTSPQDKIKVGLHINPGNSKTAMPVWKNEVPDTCVTPYSMPQSMSAFGTRHFLPTLQRNGRKASFTMSLYPMPPRSWCG
ncbi:putative transposase [Oscillibacter valericigenes Sjm18-20]|nr:putative transposase [Oscillibacter valericigenes Sjm18-20]